MNISAWFKSTAKTPVIVLAIAVFPIIFVLSNSVYQQNKNIQKLEAAFLSMMKAEEAWFKSIDERFSLVAQEFDTCTIEARKQLLKIEYSMAAIAKAYIIDKTGKVICSNDIVNALQGGVDPKELQSVTHMLTDDNLILVAHYYENRDIYVAWIVSTNYIAAMSRLDTPLPYQIIRRYGDTELFSYGTRDSSVPKGEMEASILLTHSYDERMSATLAYPGLYALVIKELNLFVLFTTLLFSGMLVIAFLTMSRSSLNNEMKRGIEKGEFRFHYQPVVDMRTGQWLGAEALIRWYKGRSIYLSPDQFIPLAEKTGLVIQFQHLCLEQVRKLTSHVELEDSDLFFAINASPEHLTKEFCEAIRPVDCAGSRFEIEITERCFSDLDISQLRNSLEVIEHKGYQISLDDFGTGKTGLTYLSELPINKIKIDRRYIQAINTDTVNFIILKSIVSLFHNLNVTIIAEGVETQEQKEWLIEHGIYFGQGWHFSRDLPADQFIEQFTLQHPVKRVEMALQGIS
ncbi:EAL domain-containing protein [Vibrio sonorensis]|uniref:EAL domain-containing protein n=1 Tax=Vibrio sonorensis TaxID=1004316 RepID=UPI0008D99924|nr:EAL domain-containing protein [Vibrio sonorensis]